MKRFLRTKSVHFIELRLPGNWKARLLRPHVKDWAAGILAGDPIQQRPGVRRSDMACIWGGDRLAAAHIAGLKEVDVDLWECDDAEMLRMRAIENAYRRIPELEAQRWLVEQREVELQAGPAVDAPEDFAAPSNFGDKVSEITDSVKKPRRGRPKEPRAEARRQVAKQVGKSESAVKQDEQRAKKKAAAPPPPPAPAPAPPMPGADIAEAIDAIARLLITAAGKLTSLAKAHPELGPRFGWSVRYELSEVAGRVRAMRPDRGCLYCKSVPALLENCAGCKGSGWITDDQVAQVPHQLLAEGAQAGVYLAPDRFVLLSDMETA